MKFKNLFLVFSLILPIPTSAQTLRVAQLPPNQSVVPLGTKPPLEYRLTPNGDAVSITLVRFGIYPLWPLTVADIGEITITKGNGSVLAQKVPTKRDASSLDLSVSSGFSVGNLAEEALFFNITPKQDRPEGIVVVKLEEIVSIGEKTRGTQVLLGNDRFIVALKFPATEIHPTILREGSAPNEILTIRFATEQEKQYQLEETSFFSAWNPVARVIGGTGAKVQITLPVTYDQMPHFYRIAVTAKVGTNNTPPSAVPPQIQKPSPLPIPPSSGPVGFGYSGQPQPGQPSFGYP